MVRRRGQAGYTLMETIVAMTIFVVLILIVFQLTSEMRQWEKRLPISYMKHPQVIALVARMRRDVMDAHTLRPYRSEHDGYRMSEKVLILETLGAAGGVHMVVWDFSENSVVRRISYVAGRKRIWVARGLPSHFSQTFQIGSVEVDDELTEKDIELQDAGDRPYGVRILAMDQRGKIAIDQTFQPRVHE